MKHAEYVADEWMRRLDGQGRAQIIQLIRSCRRDLLTDLIAWCYRHPDAPAQALLPTINTMMNEGDL